MLTRYLLAALLCAAPVVGTAQQSTRDQLTRAIAMYNAFNIEGARPILLNIISPSYLLQVKPEERVTALKYLGASYAILDKRDSAVTFFSAALDFDPFTDLDPREFSASELGAFSEAKQRIFKVALRPIVARIIDSTYSFRLISTQRANLTVTIIDLRDTTRQEVLFQAENNGSREVPWRGLMRSGRRAEAGTYELRVEGRSVAGGGAGGLTVDRQLFRIEHVYEPLEDTLRAFAPNELLIQEYAAMSPWYDLIKGATLATAAVALPLIALNRDVRWTTHAATASTVGVASAGIAFSYRRKNRKIPANVAENERRRQQRNDYNGRVRARNETRLAATILLICPPAGCPR
jgi:hypothetical protein